MNLQNCVVRLSRIPNVEQYRRYGKVLASRSGGRSAVSLANSAKSGSSPRPVIRPRSQSISVDHSAVSSPNLAESVSAKQHANRSQCLSVKSILKSTNQIQNRRKSVTFYYDIVAPIMNDSPPGRSLAPSTSTIASTSAMHPNIVSNEEQIEYDSPPGSSSFPLIASAIQPNEVSNTVNVISSDERFQYQQRIEGLVDSNRAKINRIKVLIAKKVHYW